MPPAGLGPGEAFGAYGVFEDSTHLLSRAKSR